MGLKEWMLNFLNLNININIPTCLYIVDIIINLPCCMDERLFIFTQLRKEMLLNSMSVIVIILVTTTTCNIKEQPFNFTQRKELLLYFMCLVVIITINILPKFLVHRVSSSLDIVQLNTLAREDPV